MASKKTKKPAKTSGKKKTQKKQKRSFFGRVFKLLFVLGLWLGILGTIIIAWFASELPQITADVKFERKRAITFLAADGSVLSQIGELKGESVNAQDLPMHVIHALISVEDRRFYSHFGIDPIGISRAMVTNVRLGRFAQGGSTVTQQLAKNLFLTQDRTLKRKIQEAILAVWLEHKLTKDEILTAYFNRVYFGAGTYGIQAAAKKYFKKDAKDLSVYEGAMLVGLLKAPSRYSPMSNPDLAEQRTDVVLKAMADAGYRYRETDGGKYSLAESTVLNGRQERYFIDWLMDEINRNVGAIEEDLIVQTTLSISIQNRAEQVLLEKLQSLESEHVEQGAVVVLENNGAVRAMVGGKNYGESQFNRATQAIRPPGSSFKPFVYLTALNKGWRPQDRVLDAPITQGSYRPKNFGDLYYGEVTLEQALEKSLNTVAVRLAEQIGSIGYVIGTARKLGITSDLDRNLSLALGSSGVTLLEMVSAYTVFPNLGVRPEPFAILSIKDEEGNVYYRHSAAENVAHRVFDSRTMSDMNMMLQNVVSNGTAKAANPGFAAGGKTGTSQDFRDAWFIGYTGKYTAGVWLGNDDNSPMDRMTGGKAPAQIWSGIMRGTESTQLAVSDTYQNQYTRKQESSGGGFGAFLSRIVSGGQRAQEKQPRPQYND